MRKLFALFALALIACSDPREARRVLDENGYSNIQTTGYKWFACSQDDTFHTGFTATNPNGRSVSGVVCSGWLFRASTIRF